MTTSAMVLTDAYQLVATGACHVTKAKLGLNKPNGVSVDFAIDQPKQILVSVGSSLPANDTWNYKEFEDEYSYNGSQGVYMRTVSGEFTIKIDTF